MKYLLIYFSSFLLALILSSCESAVDSSEIVPLGEHVELRSEELIQYPQIETIVEISAGEIDGLEESASYQDFLASQQLSPTVHRQVFTDTDEMFYAVEFHHPESRQISLALYPREGELYALILEEFIVDDQNTTVEATSFATQEHIGYFPISTSGPGYSDPIYKPTCRESSGSFSVCMGCAWAELNDSFAGTVVCSTNPHLCLAASAIHCSPLLIDTV